jgi:hypothetical protein
LGTKGNKYPEIQICNGTVTFENSEPPGNFSELPQSGRLNRLSRQSPEPLGKTRSFRDFSEETKKDNRSLKFFVAGIDFVLDVI